MLFVRFKSYLPKNKQTVSKMSRVTMKDLLKNVA